MCTPWCRRMEYRRRMVVYTMLKLDELLAVMKEADALVTWENFPKYERRLARAIREYRAAVGLATS